MSGHIDQAENKTLFTLQHLKTRRQIHFFNHNLVPVFDFSILFILGDDQSEIGLLGSTSKILGTSGIYSQDPCGGEKNLGSVCFEQGEACSWLRY